MNKTIQTFEWGSIEWLVLSDDNSINNMNVGISTMFPHALQAKHVHCGDEQFIYVLSGQGEQRIGDTISKIEPGNIFHIPAGSIHETTNVGDDPIVKLLVSVPATLKSFNKPFATQSTQNNSHEDISLLSIVEKLHEKVIRPLKLPIAFFDENNQLIFRNQEYPEYCKKHCHIEQDVHNCELYAHRNSHLPPYYKDATAYVCPRGISLHSLAIVHQGELIGFIKAGHVRITKGTQTTGDEPYEVPRSTVSGILQTMHRLADEIGEMYQYENLQEEITRREGSLNEYQRQKFDLQESLKTTQTEVFNLQIERHFLFNTISTIASMAIKEKAFSTYYAINDLGQLFRYTLRTTAIFVEFREELEYLENYTNLQKLRFDGRIEVDYQVPVTLFKEMVPFNFLQPIVENCFKHAYKSYVPRNPKILISAKKVDSNVIITIEDNGCGIGKKDLDLVNQRIRDLDVEGGTSMVAKKLASLYGTNHHFKVERMKQGTRTRITLPLSTN